MYLWYKLLDWLDSHDRLCNRGSRNATNNQSKDEAEQ